MKWLALAIALIGAYFLGSHNARKTAAQPEASLGIESEFEQISRRDLREYKQLKDDRDRYDKANEILATIVQLFLADLGLQRKAKCSLEPGEFPPPPFAAKEPAAETRRSRKVEGKKDAVPLAPADEKNKGITRALYQAILWRPPDIKEEREFPARHADPRYFGEAQNLIRSKEFLQLVEPNHTAQQIINRMRTVFTGRCAFQNELREDMDHLSSNGPGRVVDDLLRSALQKHREQMLAGGFPPLSCDTVNL